MQKIDKNIGGRLALLTSIYAEIFEKISSGSIKVSISKDAIKCGFYDCKNQIKMPV